MTAKSFTSLWGKKPAAPWFPSIGACPPSGGSKSAHVLTRGSCHVTWDTGYWWVVCPDSFHVSHARGTSKHVYTPFLCTKACVCVRVCVCVMYAPAHAHIHMYTVYGWGLACVIGLFYRRINWTYDDNQTWLILHEWHRTLCRPTMQCQNRFSCMH